MEAKTKTIFGRLPKGSKYYFIKQSELKLCFTNDCYFDSDDEKFQTGNYFLTREAAAEVAEYLQEKFAEKLRSIAYFERVNERGFIKEVIGIAEKYKLRKKADAMPDLAADALIQGIDEYKKKKAELTSERNEIMEQVRQIITKAPKE